MTIETRLVAVPVVDLWFKLSQCAPARSRSPGCALSRRPAVLSTEADAGCQAITYVSRCDVEDSVCSG